MIPFFHVLKWTSVVLTIAVICTITAASWILNAQEAGPVLATILNVIQGALSLVVGTMAFKALLSAWDRQIMYLQVAPYVSPEQLQRIKHGMEDYR